MRTMVISADSKVVEAIEGTPEIAPRVNSGKDGRVLNSSTGKYPQPLADNVQTEATYEANRVLAIKHAQFPKR